MANAVDRLFEEVLSKLPQTPDPEMDVESDWPDIFEEIDDALDNPPDSDDDQLRPYQDIRGRDGEIDRLAGRPVVIELPDDEKDLVEGGVRARGFEAIAFYKSKRFQHLRPYVGRWGIFYIDEGLSHIAWLISQAKPGYENPRKLARDFLWAHEHFHFRADIQTLMLEATLGRHLHIPTRQRFKGRRTHFVEEAIANRQAYKWAKRQRVGLEEFARDFMLCQPNAYARFLEPITDLAGEWVANVVDAQPPRCPPRSDLAPWVTSTPNEFMWVKLCPEWVINSSALSRWIDPTYITAPIKEIEEDKKFLKTLSKLHALRKPWDKTKEKLFENKNLPSLNFKPWSKAGPSCYSVKVNEGDRAHLQKLGDGKWLAIDIGSHTDLGHDA
jgi:hypothetical protein